MTLSVVGTPIGNLADISRRAIETLASADVIFCEDTRRTRKLLTAISVTAPALHRLDQHQERAGVSKVLAALDEGRRVALVTDAGMPVISDPGALVVAAVAAAGHRIEVVPGPDSVSAALSVSGLPVSDYYFAGFLPRKGRGRAEALTLIAATPSTVVIFEAPLRVKATIQDLLEVCGPTRAFVAARELTKLHEQIWRGTLGGAHLEMGEVGEPKGEWVLILGPSERAGEELDDEAVERALAARMAAGADRSRAVAEVVAETGVRRNRVYRIALDRLP